MTSQLDVLRRITGKLERAGIPYMISGSVASSIHGEPRATNDVDLVVEPSDAQLEAFIRLVEGECYISPEAAREALRDRSMFNLVDHATGWKLDLIIRRDRPFSVEEFRRRRPENVGDVELYLVSPEDALLSKLEWAGKTESERQMRDALGIAVSQGASLDREYLRKWARELELGELLDCVLTDAGRVEHDE